MSVDLSKYSVARGVLRNIRTLEDAAVYIRSNIYVCACVHGAFPSIGTVVVCLFACLIVIVLLCCYWLNNTSSDENELQREGRKSL